MTVSQENLNREEQQNGLSAKKYPISAGTFLFLFFNFLLILGFCKFSFYVLKNHRNAIDRDTLIKTYVDVQPYSGARKDTSSYYIALKNQNSAAPAPFFVKDNNLSDEFPPAVNLQNQQNKNGFPSPVLEAAPIKKRPPVIKNIRKSSTVPAIEPTTTDLAQIKTVENKNPQEIALDTLMNSGLSLLTESDEAIVASEALLEDIQTEPSASDFTNESSKTPDVKKTNLALKAKPDKKQEQKKENIQGTRWIDIAQLRKELSKQTMLQKEVTKQKNTALLEMNNSRQTAALNIQTTSDAIETDNTASSKKQTDTAEKTQNPSALLKQKETTQNKEIKNAVVQDIPFAGTAAPAQQTTNAMTSLAGNSPNLWKIAKVRGTPKNDLALKTKDEDSSITKQNERQNEPENDILSDKTQNKSVVIYRNGKESSVYTPQTKKSLNWLDRQEAAVWTSMSQSDTPSVWSTAADSKNLSTNTAKAFRIADEQAVSDKQTQDEKDPQKNNEINSAPIRIVGQEEKIEAKTNPLLLPLGSPAPETKPANIAADTPKSSDPVKVNLTGMSDILNHSADPAGDATSEDKKQTEEDKGIVNKLFSFFGKAETDSVPNIGSGTQDDEKTDQKDKASAQKETKTEKQKITQKAKQLPTTNQKIKKQEPQIVPTELRLTFKPNSSEMSAQSVKWVKAFGQRAKKDIQNAVEVRMSNIDPDLQEKRFALIHSTLTGVGMEDVQIIPLMTDRTPHTIVLRMIVLPEEGYTEYTTESGGIKERFYYKKW